MYSSRSLLKITLIAVLAGFVLTPAVSAYWVWSPSEGKFVSPASSPKQTVDQLYSEGLRQREAGEIDKAIRTFQSLVRTHSTSAYAPEAQYLIAVLFQQKGKLGRAVKEYQKLVKDFPQSGRVDEVVGDLFELGESFLTGKAKTFMGIPISPSVSKSIGIFQFIVDQAPYSAYGDQAQFNLGTAQQKKQNWPEAIKAFETLIERHPASPLVEEAYYQLAESSYEFSKIAKNDQRTAAQADSHLRQFVTKYSSSSLAERARSLRNELDEQDAEKNYRIGLYYEKEGFIESALIYYDEVRSRYARTPFGKKAAERLEKLKEPGLSVNRDQEAIERRLAEVEGLLAALSKEEAAPGSSKQTSVSDVVPLKRELETERASLLLAQGQFEKEKQGEYHARYKALRDRERNLKTKFKTFEKRRKLLKENPSPELKEAFDRWHESLLKEQEELREERKRLGAFGTELKPESRFSFFNWLPFVGPSRLGSPERLVQFNEKEWIKLASERQKLTEERQDIQSQLEQISKSLLAVEREEFEHARTEPWFEERLAENFRAERTALGVQKEKWNQALQALEQVKDDFRNRYGAKALAALALEENVYFEGELIASGTELEEKLKSLNDHKASLSEAWLRQKEKVQTISQAFRPRPQVSSVAESKSSVPSSEWSQEESEKQARLLKKRIKYLEREVRKRLDQIQDWERENAKRMDRLDRALHPKRLLPKLNQAGNAVSFPVVGAYKLGKAFLFGLPDRNREVSRKAREKLSKDSDAVSQEQMDEVRKLHEEIEIQSILIQGRAEEVNQLNQQLSELYRQGGGIPGFTFHSMLVERMPHILNYSVTSARSVLPEENPEAVMIDRLDRETRTLRQMEEELTETDQKMKAIGEAIRRLEFRSAVPAAQATDLSEEALKGKNRLESELKRLKSELDSHEASYRNAEQLLEETFFKWYQNELNNGFVPKFSDDQARTLVEERRRLAQEKVSFENQIRGLAPREQKLMDEQIQFLDRKFVALQNRFSKIKKRSMVHEEVLTDAIERARAEREDLIRHQATLEQLLSA